MSLQKIDWRTEALEFARIHDTRNHMVVQLVENAMKRGAEIAVEQIGTMIHEANDELNRKRKASAPHQQTVKPIKLDHETT